MVIFLFFVLAVIVTLVDGFLYLTVNPKFYKRGIPVFYSRTKVKVSIGEVDFSFVENERTDGFILVGIDDETVAFRERFLRRWVYYFSVMRGSLAIDPVRNEVRVVGFLNYATITMLLFMILLFELNNFPRGQETGKFLVPIIIVVASYLIQVVRYLGLKKEFVENIEVQGR